MNRPVLTLLLGALWLAAAPLHAAELPIFDAHVHYSHDAVELTPPRQAADILRKAGLKRALVSSSGDAGTQKLLAEAPDIVSLRCDLTARAASSAAGCATTRSSASSKNG